MTANVVTPPRQCKGCQVVLQGKRHRQQYCSLSCANRATSTGRKGPRPHLWKVQPRACLVCQTVFRTTNESTVLCSRSCSGKWRRSLNPNARGWYKTVHGYIILYKPEYPGATKAGYIMEHRWVMEQQLGRQLTKGEVVHHRDGNKANNAPENLQVMLKSQHDSHTQETRTRLVTCPSCRHEFPLAGNARAVKPR
jgi:hypothetical protein